MSATICGHEREALIWAITYARDVWANNDDSLRELQAIDWHAKHRARFDALSAIIDPAKFAAIMAETLRGLGLTVDVCKAIAFRGATWIVVGNDPREEDALTMPEARALLLQWLSYQTAAEALAALEAM